MLGTIDTLHVLYIAATPIVTQVVDLVPLRNRATAKFPHYPMEHERLPVESAAKVIPEVPVWIGLMASRDETSRRESRKRQSSRCVAWANEFHSSPFQP